MTYTKGSYILVTYLGKDLKIRIGKLGIIDFIKGYYCYVGSAFGKIVNLENRIRRYKKLNREKKGNLKWHIDYFLVSPNVSIKRVITFNKKIECEIAKIIEKNSNKTIFGFGSSDCKCKSHFYYFKSLRGLKRTLKSF